MLGFSKYIPSQKNNAKTFFKVQQKEK